MSEFTNAVPTMQGLRLLAKAQAGDAQLEFTRIAIGDGTYNDTEKQPSELYSRTALKSEKLSYTASEKTYENDRTAKLTFLISNWNTADGQALFDEDFNINEMGLYCKEKGGDNSTEVLYSIAVAKGTGDPFPSYTGANPTEIEQVWYATVDKASNVVITIDPNKMIVDDALSTDSTNPVENRAITTEINAIRDLLIPSEQGAFGVRYWNGQFQVVDENGEWSKAKVADITLMSISVDKLPSKTSYTAGDTLSVDGIKVTALFSDGSTTDVTDKVTYSPAVGSTLTENNTKVSVNYVWHNVDLNADVTAISSFNIAVDRVLSRIAVTSLPVKTSYNKGEKLDLSGLEVTAYYTSNNNADVTSQCAITPVNGSTLNAVGDNTITITYTENGVQKTASTTVKVNVKTVSWSTGTDAEIASMIAAADAGQLKLSDYWTVGQERKVHLSAMAQADGVGESHVAQDITLVLMNAGGKVDVNGKEVNFIVGQKNGLSNGTNGEWGYMNPTDTNSGGWDGCARRTWCNNTYRNAFPSTLKGIFKKFRNITASGGNNSNQTVSEDYFALPSEVEIFGKTTYANAGAENGNKQFKYYETSANRVKKIGDNSSANDWWERSPDGDDTSSFCYVSHDGTPDWYNASYGDLLAPFGCI